MKTGYVDKFVCFCFGGGSSAAPPAPEDDGEKKKKAPVFDDRQRFQDSKGTVFIQNGEDAPKAKGATVIGS